MRVLIFVVYMILGNEKPQLEYTYVNTTYACQTEGPKMVAKLEAMGHTVLYGACLVSGVEASRLRSI